MNWFKYRLPHSQEIVCGASYDIVPELVEGFVITPFERGGMCEVTIPFDFVPDRDMLKVDRPYALHVSTPREEFLAEVHAIKEDLKGKRGKTVAARAITFAAKIDINATFDSLCDAYPDAFIFAFSASATGTWIGASPELLLSKDGERIYTMALAGTRPASSQDDSPEWDEKNADEQRMVTEFITDSIKEFCQDVSIEKTFTKIAGNVEHICTPILARINENSALIPLLFKLSPTPALCGSDRERSLDIISRYERFDRECYGGFCGPFDPKGKTDLYVILRCAQCNPRAVCVYAGCGITPLSDPEAEWLETEMKSKTIINKLKTSEK